MPQAWFTGIGALCWLTCLIGFVILIKGADWLVEGASGLAYRLGISKIIVGATIVSLGTTSPEAAVSVMAAWGGNTGLALGNAVGSIILDTGLIFGIGCLMTRLPADKFVLARQGWVQFGSGVLLAVLAYYSFLTIVPPAVPTIGRVAGIVMMGLLVGYLWISIRWARIHPQGAPFQTPAGMEGSEGILPHEPSHPSIRCLVIMAVVGLVMVLFSSHVVVASVKVIAVSMNIPQVVIAATLVAMGTSLPELVVGISSIRKGHPELLVGNIIGADILNVLFVVGASALANPLPVVDTDPAAKFPNVFLYLQLPTVLLVLLLFRIFISRSVERGHFLRWYGYPLIAITIVFVILQVILTR